MSSLADQAITWREGQLVLLDQRKLPNEIQFIKCSKVEDVAEAIIEMVVRGAPAIGITAAYGVVLAARACYVASKNNWKSCIEEKLQSLAYTRPTAVNLGWAIMRMQEIIVTMNDEDNPENRLLQEAQRLHNGDIKANKAIGDLGAQLIENNSAVLTHCNAGALATGGYGTALGVIRSAFAEHKLKKIYAGETRPWFQGTRLTAWELLQEDIPVTLICDSAAATLMRQKQLAWVIVGADRVASNGDVANKIGTYSLAVMAKQHGVKFMVAAPTSTIDMEIENGQGIEIEVRSSAEIIKYQNYSFGPQNANVWNPVFDITPAQLIDALVTERGIVEHPNRSKIEAMMHIQ